jgi:hypothetical protein
MQAMASTREVFDALSCIGGDDQAKRGDIRQLHSLWHTACERWLQAAPARSRYVPDSVDEIYAEEAA